MPHATRPLVYVLLVLSACGPVRAQEPFEIICLDPTITTAPESSTCTACPRADEIFELSDRSLDANAICTVAPACPYGLGTDAVTVTCNAGVPIQKECQVTVQDFGLSIKPVPGPTPLWPPNHKYQAFEIASDCIGEIRQVNSCGQPSIRIDPSTVSVTIQKVTSSEPEDDSFDNSTAGDGKTCRDIQILPSRSAFQIRRERRATGDGRVYRVYYKVDHAASGQSTSSACTFTVAHSLQAPVAETSVCHSCVGDACGSCPGPQPSCSEN